MVTIQERGINGLGLQIPDFRRTENLHPPIPMLERIMNNATRQAALATAREIAAIHYFNPQIDGLKKEKLKGIIRRIDGKATDIMGFHLNNAPIKTHVVAGEGRKEVKKYGEAMPTLMGIYGEGFHRVSAATDPVEGTEAAARNTAGAITTLGATTHNGIKPTPEDTDYMNKLFGPKVLKGKVSIVLPTTENLKIIQGYLGIDPKQIRITALNRERNKDIIQEASEFGAEVTLIKAGDLSPCLKAITGAKTIEEARKNGIDLVIGIGGFEEGLIAAIAAKALGAVAEGKEWYEKDYGLSDQLNGLLTLDDLVLGKAEDCVLSVTSITGDPWFDLERADHLRGATETLVITNKGAKVVDQNNLVVKNVFDNK